MSKNPKNLNNKSKIHIYFKVFNIVGWFGLCGLKILLTQT